MGMFRRPSIIHRGLLPSLVVALFVIGCAAPVEYDLILRNGTHLRRQRIDPIGGRLAMDGDVIVAIGDLGRADGPDRDRRPRVSRWRRASSTCLSWATVVAHRGRPLPERHPPGRDPRGHGRGQLHGPAQPRP